METEVLRIILMTQIIWWIFERTIMEDNKDRKDSVKEEREKLEADRKRIEENGRKRSLGWFFIICFLVGVIILVVALIYESNKDDHIMVPDVRGMPVEDARTELQKSEIGLKVQPYKYELNPGDMTAGGIVIAQDLTGEHLKGDKITLTVSVVNCPVCQGKGLIDCPYCTNGETSKCPACKGEGITNGKQCVLCNGSGQVSNDCPACEYGVVTCPFCKGVGIIKKANAENLPND